MVNKNIKYSIVVPVYNEEQVIAECYKRIKQVMDSLYEVYEIIFVNDGSIDTSVLIIKDICVKDSNIKMLNFSRNFGHQIAITAGLEYALGEAIIILDADMQDPPEVIPEMLKKWQEGYEVVYGKRIKRIGDSRFKKFSAKLFYKALNGMSNVKMPLDTGDFRLIDRKVCDALKSITERNRYMRGLISWIGFKQIGIEFVREERFAGKTKYSIRKMLKLASDAITSFSYKPLRIATFSGLAISLLSFLYILFVVFEKFFTTLTVPGWSSLIAVSLFFNGIILIILGIIGEYIGRIYDESKKRPLYIISEEVGFEKLKSDG